jgi:hypothetical protein
VYHDLRHTRQASGYSSSLNDVTFAQRSVACGSVWLRAAGGVSEGTELLLLRLHAVAAASTSA